ncbi:MAG: TrkA C-terminal domain-containing protein, partial [Fibrobacteraceae bacterium]
VCPETFVGKTLKDLSLTNKLGIQVIAIRDPLETTPKIGNIADYVLRDQDVLFIIGPNEVLDSLNFK